MCLLSQIAPCNPGTDCAITLHIAAIQVPSVICADWRSIVGHPLNEDLTSAIHLCAADDVLMAQYPHRCDLQDGTAMLILFAVGQRSSARWLVDGMACYRFVVYCVRMSQAGCLS